MVDLLGIQTIYHKGPGGHVTLHQSAYIDKMVERLLPNGRPAHISASTPPYSKKFAARLIAALAGSTPQEPSHPGLLRLFQERIGCLMYLCRCTRPAVCFPVHQLAQAMSCDAKSLAILLIHGVQDCSTHTWTLGPHYL